MLPSAICMAKAIHPFLEGRMQCSTSVQITRTGNNATYLQQTCDVRQTFIQASECALLTAVVYSLPPNCLVSTWDIISSNFIQINNILANVVVSLGLM